MTIKRQQKAFYRKLYLAHLISEQKLNLPALMEITGMPRRTLQDSIADFGDIGLQVEFVQDGVRNNDGYYRMVDWGPINAQWLQQQIDSIQQLVTSES